MSRVLTHARSQIACTSCAIIGHAHACTQHIHKRAHTYTHIHTHTLTHAQHTSTRTHTHIHTHAHTHTQKGHKHAQSARTQARTHTNTYIHTYVGWDMKTYLNCMPGGVFLGVGHGCKCWAGPSLGLSLLKRPIAPLPCLRSPCPVGLQVVKPHRALFRSKGGRGL